MLRNRCLPGVLVFTAATTANAATVDDYVQACAANSNMGPELCRCVGNDASAALTAKGFEFFVATAGKDRAAVDRLRPQLQSQEMMDVTLFSIKGPARCANRLAREQPDAAPAGEAAAMESGEAVSGESAR